MELKDRTYTLVHADGTQAQISDISVLKVLINDFDYDLFLVPQDEKAYPFIHKPSLEGNELTAESLLELFEHKADGYLYYDGIPVCFFNAETGKQILVSKVEDVPFLMGNFFNVSVSDQDRDKFIDFIKKVFEDSVEQVAKEEKAEEKPVEVSVHIPDASDNTQAPAADNTQTPAADNTQTAAADNTQAPAIDPKAAEELANQSVKQIEEAAIPQEVTDKYNKIREDLVAEGYKESVYKNYRMLINPESDGSDTYLFLLTVAGCMQVTPLYLNDDTDDENVIKYKFKIDGNKKSLYYNKSTGEMVVKKPKKHEENAPAVEVVNPEQK